MESLLDAHRQVLSTLYTNLSPSPSPLLNSKLDALHAAMQATIEAQQAEVKAEVASVERRLSDSWRRVIDWRLALGEPEGKSRGSSPLLTQVEELDAVLQGMRGRMEQRGTRIVQLQKQLVILAEVLERDFLTCSLEDVEHGWEGLDLKLERMSALEREVVRCEAEVANRRNVMNANVNEIFALRAELGIHQNSSNASSSQGHDASAASSPVSDPFDDAILAHLGVGEGREKREIVATTENLARVEAKRKWLEEEKVHRNHLIQSTYDKLYPLWTMLGVSEGEMEDFVNRYMGSTSDVVGAYQGELVRMLSLKRTNLAAFINREREALSELWDALYLSPRQRLAQFPPFTVSVEPTKVWNAAHGVEEEVVNDNVSEELLIAHERERERVEGEVEKARPVLERLAKYFAVVTEMSDLEASAADPSRLLGKSTRGDPGRLLREEKARKRVVKEKPKLELELRQFIPEWEHQNGRPFLVNGVRFLDDLEQRLEAEVNEKESKKRAKTGVSASTSSQRTVPLKPQATGGALRPQQTGNSVVPIKRQLTGAASKTPAKKMAPQATGNARAPLGELRNMNDAPTTSNGMLVASHPQATVNAPRLYVQPTGGVVAHAGPGGGMKLPAGWGNSFAAPTPPSLHAPPEASNLMGGGGGGGGGAYSGYIQPQPTGGFRPRSSASSSAASAVTGWSTARTVSTSATSYDGGSC